jgi:DNA-directed RNA polymerase beta subunit
LQRQRHQGNGQQPVHGVPFATPVFDGASEEDIRTMLKLAYPEDVVKPKA